MQNGYALLLLCFRPAYALLTPCLRLQCEAGVSNDKCLRSATARTLWKKGESSAPSVFHAFLGAICERALNLYVCRGGALWLAYHRTQTQSATQWECLFSPSTDIDSYYSYDTRTRQKCFRKIWQGRTNRQNRDSDAGSWQWVNEKVWKNIHPFIICEVHWIRRS